MLSATTFLGAEFIRDSGPGVVVEITMARGHQSAKKIQKKKSSNLIEAHTTLISVRLYSKKIINPFVEVVAKKLLDKPYFLSQKEV